MLDMGFLPQIYSIVADHDMPTSRHGRQTVMFSATFPKPIQELATEFLNEYLFLTVGRVGSTNDFIEQKLLYADESSKPKKLLKLLEETRGLVLGKGDRIGNRCSVLLYGTCLVVVYY